MTTDLLQPNKKLSLDLLKIIKQGIKSNNLLTALCHSKMLVATLEYLNGEKKTDEKVAKPQTDRTKRPYIKRTKVSTAVMTKHSTKKRKMTGFTADQLQILEFLFKGGKSFKEIVMILKPEASKSSEEYQKQYIRVRVGIFKSAMEKLEKIMENKDLLIDMDPASVKFFAELVEKYPTAIYKELYAMTKEQKKASGGNDGQKFFRESETDQINPDNNGK